MSLIDGTVPIPTRRSKWKWIVPVVFTFVVLVIYGCWRGVTVSEQESARLLDQLHQQMNAGNYDAIYTESDAAFKNALTEKDSKELFAGIEKKLGRAGKAEAKYTSVEARTTGNTITTTFTTTFANDPAATEEVTWHKEDSVYRLENYSVNSRALLR